jgi:hypothetical protein
VPTHDCAGCVWQSDGQWCIKSVHESRAGGSTPSWRSTAEPEKPMTLPTLQVVLTVGVMIVGTGGAPPGVTSRYVTPVAPSWSVTASPTVTIASAA